MLIKLKRNHYYSLTWGFPPLYISHVIGNRVFSKRSGGENSSDDDGVEWTFIFGVERLSGIMRFFNKIFLFYKFYLFTLVA